MFVILDPEVFLQTPCRNPISLCYINSTGSDKSVSSDEISLTLMLNNCGSSTHVTLRYKHHFFFCTSTGMSHTCKRKITSLRYFQLQQVSRGRYQITIAEIVTFLGKQLPCHSPAPGWLPLPGHCSARCCHSLSVQRWRCSFFHIS